VLNGLTSGVSKKVKIAFKQLKSLKEVEKKSDFAQAITEQVSLTTSDEILVALEALKLRY
jgi:hypothetical protein